jgi:hypothetical protein
MKRCGLSRRRSQNASAALKILSSQKDFCNNIEGNADIAKSMGIPDL